MEKSNEKALEYFQYGCRPEDPLHYGARRDNCSKAAEFYLNGIGTGKDLSKAFEFSRLACGGGVRSSCTAMGDIYSGFYGGSPDWKRAKELYGASCSNDAYWLIDNRNMKRCSDVADIFFEGKGEPQDLKFAAKLYGYACEELKEKILAKSRSPSDGKLRRYKPDDKLMTFLKRL